MLQLSFLNFRKDSYILIEGKADTDHFYIIQSGTVQVVKEDAVVTEEGSNMLGPGDFLGVISCMSRHNQIDTAIAMTDVVLISVPYEQFPQLIEKNTSVAMKIIFSFSQKMRFLDEGLTRIALKKDAAKTDISHLFTIGEYYMRKSKFDLALYAYYHYLKAAPKGEFAAAAQKRFMTVKSMGVKIPIEVLEPKTDEMNRVYEKEAMIFCECQPGTELYIIQKGHVKITKIVDNSEVLLAVLKEGDMFGEMALLENKPRSASAIVTEDGARLLAVNRQNFNQMISTQPQLIARLTTTFAERMWVMYRQLSNTLIKDPVERMYDMLAIQLEKTRIRPIKGKPHRFNFGPEELANMCGVPKDQTLGTINKFLQQAIIRCDGTKISVTDELELSKQAAYFKRMQMIEKSRMDAKAKNNEYRKRI